MKSKRFWLLAVIAWLIFSLPMPRERASAQAPGAAAAPQPGAIKGQVQPAVFASLSASASGRVEAVLVQCGDLVQSGQVVARMEGSEQIAAQLAAARLEILQAEQALDELDRQWQVQHALAEVEIAQLQRQAALAQDRLDGLLAPVEAERLAQVSANLRLAQRQLENAQSDLRKAQKRYDNKSSIIWYFINQRTVRLHLAQLEGAVVKAQRRYDDAAEKLDELQSPPDAVDVAVAAAGLQAAQSRLADAQRRAAELQDGPRQEELELARLRLQSAQAAQLAAQEALEALRLKAPFDGVVVAAPVEAGEWLAAGQEVVLLADTSAWDVEAADVTEEIAAGLQAGAPVVVRLDAYPDVELSGRIEQVDLISREGDDEVYFPLRVRIIEAEPRLRWGLTVRLEILP